MTLRSCLSAVPREWKTPKVLVGMMVLELPLSIAALALFGIAAPDLYRTQFWQEGSDQGWNSNPNQLIYAYANYRPISTPLPWSQLYATPKTCLSTSSLFGNLLINHSTTNFNVVIAVLSVFMLLCKGIMFICSVFHPLISLFIHAGLTAIYAVSIHNQAGPDMSDPAHPQPGAPWYITKSCGPPVSQNLIGYCKQAKAAFSVTILLWYVQIWPELWNATSLTNLLAHCFSHTSFSPSSP